MGKIKTMKELKMCYIEQFGFDIIIGLVHGLDLGTILELDEIAGNIGKEKK